MEAQRLTDELERENIVAVLIEEPFFRLLKEPFFPRPGGKNILLKALNGVLEHRHHEPYFPFANGLFISPFESVDVGWLNGNPSVRRQTKIECVGVPS